MGRIVTLVVLFFCNVGILSEALPRRADDGVSSMWHVFRQIHESDVAKRPYLAARRSSSPMVIERTRIIPASEPKPLAPSTIITRIRAASPSEEEATTTPPKSALSSVWALKMSGRMSESDAQPFTQAPVERVDSAVPGQPTSSSPTFTANSNPAQAEASAKSEAVEAQRLSQQSGQTAERNQGRPQSDHLRSQDSHAEKPFNEMSEGSGRRTQQQPSLKFWEVFRKRIPEKWSVFNKAASPGVNESLVRNAVEETRLESDDKAPLDRIKGLEDDAPASTTTTMATTTTTTTQQPEPTVQRNEIPDDSSEQLAISVNEPSPAKRLTIRVDNSTFYAATSPSVGGTLVFQRTEAPDDMANSQGLEEIEIYYPGIGGMLQKRPFRIVINWSGVVVADADSTVAASETTESAELTTPPIAVESTTEVGVISVSEELVSPADFISEDDAEALTTTMPTSTTDDQLTTPLLKSSEGSALTQPLSITTTITAEPAASARSFVSVSSSSSSSSSSVSTSNGISYISHVSSSYSSSNPGSYSLNTRTSTSTASKGNSTTGTATGSIDLIAPDNSTSIVVSSATANNTAAVRSRVIQPARFWSIVSSRHSIEEPPKSRTAEIAEILPLGFLKNQSMSPNRTVTMAPLVIFMKGSSPIVLAASAESLNQFTTPKPEVKVNKLTAATSVAPKITTPATKLKSQSFVYHPRENSSDSTYKVASHNSNLTSLILAHTASLISGKPSPLFSGGNASEPGAKLKPSARQMETVSDGSPAASAEPKVHVIMATALADPPEFEFRDRSLDSAEAGDNGGTGRKYDAYWAVPTHGQLVETPNGYLVAGSSPGVSSHVGNQSHADAALPSLPRFTCGLDTALEEFILTNPSYPEPDEDAGRCDFRLHVTSANMCQVRLEFKDSRMLLPRHGSCLYQQMTVSGSLVGRATPKFCGWNSDQHFYVELNEGSADPRHVNINVHTKAAGYRYSYAIVVKQIDCRPPSHLMAPAGCFQYYHSSRTGEIKSFNFEGGQYWSEQNYKICIRTSEKTCAISMTSANGNFGLNELSNGARLPRSTPRAKSGRCNRDYLLIPDISRIGNTESGGDSGETEFTDDRVCGSKFGGSRDKRVRSGILVGPLKHDVYVMEFHAGTFRRYEARHFGPGFAINYTEMDDCPENVNRREQ